MSVSMAVTQQPPMAFHLWLYLARVSFTSVVAPNYLWPKKRSRRSSFTVLWVLILGMIKYWWECVFDCKLTEISLGDLSLGNQMKAWLMRNEDMTSCHESGPPVGASDELKLGKK